MKSIFVHLSVELDFGLGGTARAAFMAAATAPRLSLWLRSRRRSLLRAVSKSESSAGADGVAGDSSSRACSKLLAREICTPTGFPQACKLPL